MRKDNTPTSEDHKVIPRGRSNEHKLQPAAIHGQRVRNGKGHEILRREMLQDPRLSFKALGLLTYLLSLPDTWKTNSDRLAADRPGKEGRDAIRTGLRELEAAGYLQRQRRSIAGRWQWQWRYTDDPETLLATDGLSVGGDEQQEQDISAGPTMDGFSSDGSSVHIEIQEIESLERDKKHSVPPSQATSEDQNIARWREPSRAAQRADEHAATSTNGTCASNASDPIGTDGEFLKHWRLIDFIHDHLPDGLTEHETNAVGAMLERNEYWGKIFRTVCNQRDYNPNLTTTLLEAARSSQQPPTTPVVTPATSQRSRRALRAKNGPSLKHEGNPTHTVASKTPAMRATRRGLGLDGRGLLT